LFYRVETANSNLHTICLARWAPLLTVTPEADVKLSFSSDAAITAETCRRLTNSDPDLIYTILLEVDSAGHTYGWGPSNTNYVKAIETADARVGEILSALRSRPGYSEEDWLVIALTDHGEHDDPDPERSRVTWQVYSGPSVTRGPIWPSPAIVDVCVTVLTHLGLTISPSWNLDARVVALHPKQSPYATNLIVNGDAELNSGTNDYHIDRGVAGWFDISAMTLGSYGANTAFPNATSPGPPDRGLNFFLGGTTNTEVLQRVDVREAAADIDSGLVRYSLSGWFGGKTTDNDSAVLFTRFLTEDASMLGSASVGGVSAADRNSETGLAYRSTTGSVPRGTRFVEFRLATQAIVGDNDSSADNLSFTLHSPPSPELRVLSWSAQPQRFLVKLLTAAGRDYTLERSADMKVWETVAELHSLESKEASLTDTNAPTGSAFYRAAAQ
jgi:hypothetical protein